MVCSLPFLVLVPGERELFLQVVSVRLGVNADDILSVGGEVCLNSHVVSKCQCLNADDIFNICSAMGHLTRHAGWRPL